MKHLFIALLFGLCASHAFATIHRVNNQLAAHPPQLFNDLATAVSSAAVEEGDTLYLEGSQSMYYFPTECCPTTYYLQRKLTIIGPGYSLNRIANSSYNKLPAYVSHVFIRGSAAGSALLGLVFDTIPPGTVSNEGVTVQVPNVRIERCYVKKIKIANNVSGLQIRNCFFWRSADPAYTNFDNPFSATGANISVSYNIFRSKLNFGTLLISNFSSNTLEATSSSTEANLIINADIVQNNLLRGNRTVVISGPATSNMQSNWAEDGQFGTTNGNVDYNPGTDNPFGPFNTNISYDERFKLRAGSAANTAGVGGGPVGAYGGPLGYRTGGLPNIPIIYGYTTTGAAPQGGTLNVDIKARVQD